MYRGTTPKFSIELDVKTSDVEVAYLSFKQNNEVKVEKTLEDCECSDNVLTCTLTQEETLNFTAGVPLMLQVRCRMKDGTTVASDINTFKVVDVFKDGVI